MPKKSVVEVPNASSLKAKRKVQTSTWFLTINTNKIANPELTADFKEALALGFDSVEKYISYIHPDPTRNNLDSIDDIHIEYTVEVAPKTKSLHMHAVIKVLHKTKIRMRWDAFGKDLQEYLGIPEKFYVDYRVSSSSDTRLRQYLQKNWTEE